MSKIVRVELNDGLLLTSGYIAHAGYRCLLYLRVPDDWVGDGGLLEAKQEAVLENLYGKTWRSGNEDGSRYVVLGITNRVVSAREEADRIWLQPQAEDRRYQYWYYHVTDDGHFQNKDAALFNS